MCGCYRTAFNYWSQAHKLHPNNNEVENLLNEIHEHLNNDRPGSDLDDTSTWPDCGYVRRERYPWNKLEPDRLKDLSTLNDMMNKVAPKLEVRATKLPNLTAASANVASTTVTQLGVFAKEDIAPGEVILDEFSMLTANNKLQDALCDACSADLPQLDCSGKDETVSCDYCEVVFCSEKCYKLAMLEYHEALCEKDVESIAKDVPPAEAADSLYSLLLLRTLAMAETKGIHPLDVKEVKWIWGDFHDLSPQDYWLSPGWSKPGIPKTLPFSFEHNVRLPFHMLEKMDIDIFQNPQYDVWVLNTLYAKFRGTASARLSGLGGRAIRGPEVSAVHPMWCLANHSCDPNVTWEWGGNINFRVRSERVTWERNGEKKHSASGIKKGEEMLNHYCDISLPAEERREWARGALGGDCRCARCVWETEKP